MRTMTKERKKEGPRLKGKGRADTKASRQLLLLCIPAIIGYILFNYIPMGAAVIIPFKNYKFSKGILGSDWCGFANFKWIIQSVALDRALRNTVLYGLLFMVLSPVTNVIIALLLFETPAENVSNHHHVPQLHVHGYRRLYRLRHPQPENRSYEPDHPVLRR